MTRDRLISQIEAFAEARNIAPATVTSRAVGNSRLYSRLVAGGSCTMDVAEKLSDYMASNWPAEERGAA